MRRLWLLLLWPVGALAQQPVAPCATISQQVLTGPTTSVGGLCLETEYSTNTTCSIPPNKSMQLQSHQGVLLQPGFYAGGFTGGNSLSITAQKTGDFELAVFEPAAWNGTVERFEKLELGLRLPSHLNQQVMAFAAGMPGLNPYNPEDISVEAVFTAPSGWQRTVYGFYYRDYARDDVNNQWHELPTDYPWRIRFAAHENGAWQVSVTVKYRTSSGITDIGYVNLGYTVVQGSNPGNLQVGNSGYHLRFSGTGESFFAMGASITGQGATCIGVNAPYIKFKQDRAMWELYAQSGANFGRPWLGHTIWTPELEEVNNYHNRQAYMWEWDQIMRLAEDSGIYLKIVLESSIDFEYLNGYGCQMDWSHNPYESIAPNGVIEDFFSDPQVIQVYKRKLRYMVARWGYSTNVAAWELFNEVDGVGQYRWPTDNVGRYNTEPAFRQMLVDWHQNIFSYFRDTLRDQHLLTTSAKDGLYWPLYDLEDCDIVSFHQYLNHRNANLIDRFKAVGTQRGQYNDYGQPRKPVLMDEFAASGANQTLEVCDASVFTNDIWAAAMMGQYGAGLYWFPRPVLGDTGVGPAFNFHALRDFFSDIDFEQHDFKPFRFPIQEDKIKSLDPAKHQVGAIYCVNTAGERAFAQNGVGDRAFGVVFNRTDYWVTNSTTWQCSQQPQDSINSVEAPGDHPPTLTSPIYLAGKNVKLSNMLSLTNYMIEWYLVDNNQLLYSQQKYHGLGKFTVPVPNLIAGRSMVAFKIYPMSQSSFKSAAVAAQDEELTFDAAPLVLLEDERQVSVFPNPAADRVSIEALGGIEEVWIYSIEGQFLLSQRGDLSQKTNLDVSNLSEGMYLLRIRLVDGSMFFTPIVRMTNN